MPSYYLGCMRKLLQKFYCQWVSVSVDTSIQFHTSHLLFGLGGRLVLSSVNTPLMVYLYSPTPRPIQKQIKMDCIELYGVHIAERQIPTQIPIGFCVNLSVAALYLVSVPLYKSESESENNFVFDLCRSLM